MVGWEVGTVGLVGRKVGWEVGGWAREGLYVAVGRHFSYARDSASASAGSVLGSSLCIVSSLRVEWQHDAPKRS